MSKVKNRAAALALPICLMLAACSKKNDKAIAESAHRRPRARNPLLQRPRGSRSSRAGEREPFMNAVSASCAPHHPDPLPDLVRKMAAEIHHSITLSARMRTDGGIVRPISRAVRRLRTSSILS